MSETLVCAEEPSFRLAGCVGGVVSPVGGGGGGGGPGAGQASVAALVTAAGERFPAASNASTLTEYVVPHARSEIVALACVVVVGAPLSETREPATPTLSVDPVHESERLSDV